MGRKLEYPERLLARLAPGAISRIKKALRTKEPVTAFLREAIEAELERREAKQEKKKPLALRTGPKR